MSLKPFVLLSIAAAVFLFSASPGEAVDGHGSSCDDSGATPPPQILEAYVPGIDYTGEEVQLFTGCLPGIRFVEAMAVTFSVEVDFSTLLPDQFKVIGSSGDFVDVSIPTCATLLPAGIGELFTVTLAGNLVSSSDVSRRVEVVVSPTTGTPLLSIDGVELTGLSIDVDVMSGPKLVLARVLGRLEQIQTYWSASVFGPLSGGAIPSDALANFTLVDVNDNFYKPTGFDDNNGMDGDDLDNILVLNIPEEVQAENIVEVRVEANTVFDISLDPNPLTRISTAICRAEVTRTQGPAQSLSQGRVPSQAPIACNSDPPEILKAYLPGADYSNETIQLYNGSCSPGPTNVELMAFTFSVEVDFDTVVLDQFQIMGVSGDFDEAICAILLPAGEGELFTVTLAGNFSTDPDLLPTRVDVVVSNTTGNSLLSVDGEDLTGLSSDVDVTRGPELIIARLLDGAEQIQTYWSSSVFGPLNNETLSADALANFTLVDVNGNDFMPTGFDDNNALGITGDLDNVLVLNLPEEVQAGDILEIIVEANTVFDTNLTPNPLTSTMVKAICPAEVIQSETPTQVPATPTKAPNGATPRSSSSAARYSNVWWQALDGVDTTIVLVLYTIFF